MVHEETVCPPAWISYGGSDSTLILLRKLLKKDSVEILSLKYTGKMYEMTCAGCQCLTGRKIEITIWSKDQSKVERLRFYRPWVYMVKQEKNCDWTITLDDDQLMEKFLEKNIHAQRVFYIGPTEKTNDNCYTLSGRTIYIRVEKDDIQKAREEGFEIDPEFKQY